MAYRSNLAKLLFFFKLSLIGIQTWTLIFVLSGCFHTIIIGFYYYYLQQMPYGPLKYFICGPLKNILMTTILYTNRRLICFAYIATLYLDLPVRHNIINSFPGLPYSEMTSHQLVPLIIR